MINRCFLFPKREQRNKVDIRRCWVCFECRGCEVKFGDKSSFYSGTAYCWKCRKTQLEEKCDVCNVWKIRTHFSTSQLHHRKTWNLHLRCIACHVCVTCKAEKRAEDLKKQRPNARRASINNADGLVKRAIKNTWNVNSIRTTLEMRQMHHDQTDEFARHAWRRAAAQRT